MKRQTTKQWSESFDEEEIALIQSALVFSTTKTLTEIKREKRDEIADILDHLKVDYETIVASVLVIGLENNDFDSVAMAEHYSPAICDLVSQSKSLMQQKNDWVDILSGSSIDSSAGSRHMMLLNMMRDARVVFIVLAHQILIMRGLSSETEDVQRQVASETENVFAPLANRLGIGQLKWELEDLAFRYLQPIEYKKIAKALEERRVDREQYMVSLVEELRNKLNETGLGSDVQGRAKHIFSIWKKMQKKHLEFSDLYDVRAVRVLVKDIAACYTVLSIVHDLWQFIPSEYDDYVAAPKANNYQSLHTAVLGPNDKTVEIQIRTHDMHTHAELGVAAHWRYKEGGKRDESIEQRLESLRNILNQGGNVGTKLQKALRIYVLSPKGLVVELPVGGTPLDFAYHIHSEVGNKCRGAKVNGKMVPLTTPLLNGQTVEIITVKSATPSRDWLVSHLGYLRSPRARSKVKAWFRREFRDEHISAGKLALMKQVSILPSNTALKNLATTFNMHHVDDLYAEIGRNKLGVNQVLNSLKIPEGEIEEKKILLHGRNKDKPKSDIIIDGVGDLMTSLARCCKPLPGESVTGFLTQGKGVTVHRENCSNVMALKLQYPQRFIPVTWGANLDESYEVDVEIIALDRSGLLRDVMSVFSGRSINVNAANTYTDKKLQQAKMRLTLELHEPEQLSPMLAKLVNLRGVLEAVRIK